MSHNPWGAPGYAAQQAPTPGSVPMAPSLSPPGWSDFAQGGGWAQIPAYLPTLTLPFGPNVGVQQRRRPLTFTSASTTTLTTVVSFDVPTTIYALTAGAYDTAGANLPVGLSPLDTFRVQFVRANGDRFDTAAGLGSTLCGTALQPALIGPNGWMIDRGGAVSVTVTTLRTNLSVDIVLWGAEVVGPYNFTWSTSPFGLRG